MKIFRIFKFLTLSGLSIQQRLPILICLLLCGTILAISLTSYYEVKKAAMKMGETRIRTLTDQLGGMFGKSSQTLTASISRFSRNDTLMSFLDSKGVEKKLELQLLLKELQKDSTWVLVQLLDGERIPILSSGNMDAARKLPLKTIFSDLKRTADTASIGKLYAVNKTAIYYPIVTRVSNNGKLLGYLVIWRLSTSTKQRIEELSRLLGAGAILQIGNSDGSLWTNLLHPVSAPPVDLHQANRIFNFVNNEGEEVIGAIYPITKTPWWLLIEFPEDNVLEPALKFLNWLIPMCLLFILLGIFLTWLMSRNIIEPLDQLTKAAIAISAGKQSEHVVATRIGELGKLADAFNKMGDQINLTQIELENKVVERTSQLQAANNELEAFSYSVSHDLRSPLRAMNGYSKILSEDFGHLLDDEAKSYLNGIQKNSAKMGELIDDLLDFSRLGRMEIVNTSINMNALVKTIRDEEMQGHEDVSIIIHDMPEVKGSIPMLRQVWRNLISNALKFSKNSPAAEIEIGSVTENNQLIYFIKDNGAGFDMQYYGKIFGVFQRLHSHEEFPGTGIGLAIVQRIIHRHNGTIWATSKVNEGSVFSFSLPLELKS